MNKPTIIFLKTLRKVVNVLTNKEASSGRDYRMFSNKSYSNDLIFDLLMDDKPRMIARFGASELRCLVNYKGVQVGNKNIRDFINGDSLPWWWELDGINQLEELSGFFPANILKVEQFCKMMIEDMSEVDLLGSWLREEKYFLNETQAAKRVVLEDLEPFFATKPWTRALEGKKVLVVHPFSETIESQYRKRNLLFDRNLLPDFELTTIKAVQSVARERTEFKDWFEALEAMKRKIDEVDYDICIIGCGAYGFPLAAHVKRSGKKAIHMAGATQLLFGIKGKRWENFIVWPYANLFNEHWVRPGEHERPKGASVVEGGCYW